MILQQQSHEAINWGPYIELFGFTPKMAQTIATVWYEDDQMHKLFDELITATMGLPKTIDRTSAAIKVETPIKQY